MHGFNAIGEPLDRQFAIKAISREQLGQFDEHHAILFRATDKALVATLCFYRDECKRSGAGVDALTNVDLLISRVRRYQTAYKDAVKVADLDPVLGSDILVPNKT